VPSASFTIGRTWWNPDVFTFHLIRARPEVHVARGVAWRGPHGVVHAGPHVRRVVLVAIVTRDWISALEAP
jgi:hypothetical protein